MTKTQLITIPVLGALMLAGGGIAGYVGMASAQSATNTTTNERPVWDDSTPRVGGEVAAVSGTTITVNDMRKGGTYTIDASGATFMKEGASSDISAVTIGNHVMAEGTLSGTTLTATKVMTGMKGGHGGPGGHGRGHGVMGEVTAVDGSNITVTGKDGQSYTVNAGSATVQKMVAGALSDIAVGDRIGVQGTVSGTSVTATTIMDDVPERPTEMQ
ncbi:MAG: DUF5666 domain-containing protein [Minisyncoccia bacterium]